MAAIQYLTAPELLKVLDQAKRKGAREACMFILAYGHGLRASEIARLTLEDVRDGQIDVRRLKNSLHTIQPLRTDANPLLDEKAALKTWLEVRGDADGSKILFTSRQGSGLTRRQIYNLFSDIAMHAGIEVGRRNVHILKHTIAAHLIRSGVGIVFVQQILGHRHISSTSLYTHISQAEAAVKANDALKVVFA